MHEFDDTSEEGNCTNLSILQKKAIAQFDYTSEGSNGTNLTNARREKLHEVNNPSEENVFGRVYNPHVESIETFTFELSLWIPSRDEFNQSDFVPREFVRNLFCSIRIFGGFSMGL